MKTSAGTEIPETNQHCDCGLTGGCEKCNPMFKADLYIEAWYLRTLECIDMDNGDRIIPPPTKSEWKFGVKKDLESLLTQQRTELLEEIKKIIDKFTEENMTLVFNPKEIPNKAEEAYVQGVQTGFVQGIKNIQKLLNLLNNKDEAK